MTDVLHKEQLCVSCFFTLDAVLWSGSKHTSLQLKDFPQMPLRNMQLNLCSGKLRLQYCFIRSSIMDWCFFQSHFTVSWRVLLFSSAQWDVQPGLIRDQSIDFQAHRKKGCCLPCNTKVLSRPNQHLLIISCWPLPPGVQFSVQLVCYEMCVCVTVELKRCPGTFVLTQK